jgi:hypothetical protein
MKLQHKSNVSSLLSLFWKKVKAGLWDHVAICLCITFVIIGRLMKLSFSLSVYPYVCPSVCLCICRYCFRRLMKSLCCASDFCWEAYRIALLSLCIPPFSVWGLWDYLASVFLIFRFLWSACRIIASSSSQNFMLWYINYVYKLTCWQMIHMLLNDTASAAVAIYRGIKWG